MALATLTVDLDANLAKFSQDLQEAVHRSKESTDKISAAFVGLRTMLGAFGIGLGLKEFFESAIEQNIEFERSVNQLNSTLKATQYAAGLTKQELEGLVQTMASATAFDDDDIRAAEVALLRFRNIQGDTFTEALKHTLDYAAAQRTTAAAAAETVGRAYSEPLNALRQLKSVGVELTQSERDLIRAFEEAGNAMGAQRVLAEALTRSLGGTAQGENTGLYGATRSFSKAWQDLQLAFGQVGGTRAVVSGLDYITNTLRVLDHDIEQFKGAETLTAKINAAGAFLDPLRRVLQPIAGAPPELVEPTTDAEREAGRAEREKAAAGRRAQDERREYEARLRRQYEALQTRIAQEQAAMGRLIQINQQAAAAQSQELQFAYDRGLISAQAYYDKRTEIARAAAESDIAAVQRAIEAQRALLASPQTTSQQRPAIQGELVRLATQQQQFQARLAATAEENAQRAIDGEQRYEDAVGLTTAALLDQQGRYAEAAQQRIDIENRIYEAQIRARGDVFALEQLRTVEANTVAQGRLNELYQRYASIRQQEESRELSIQAQLAASGASPEAQLRALNQINAARLDSLPALRSVVAEMARQAEIAGDTSAIANAQRLAAELKFVEANARGAAFAAQEFQIVQQRAALLFRQQATEEARVENLRIAGARSSLGTMVELDRVRRQSIDALNAEANALQVIAERTRDPATLQAVDEMRVAIERLQAEAQSTANVFRDVFKDALVDPLIDFANKTKTAGEAWNDFAMNVLRGLERIAAQEVAQAIFGLGGPGGGLGNLFGGLFSRASGAGAGAPITLAAEGGVFTRPTLIAEHGQPEAAVPLSGGRFIPVKMIDGGGGRGNVSVVVNVDAGGQTSTRGTADSRDAERLGKVISGLVHDRIMQEKRPGGLLWEK